MEEARFLLAEAAMAEAAEIQCAETARMSLADLEARALSWSSAAQSEAARPGFLERSHSAKI